MRHVTAIAVSVLLACLALAERKRAFPRAFRLPGPLAADGVRALLEASEAAAE